MSLIHCEEYVMLYKKCLTNDYNWFSFLYCLQTMFSVLLSLKLLYFTNKNLDPIIVTYTVSKKVKLSCVFFIISDWLSLMSCKRRNKWEGKRLQAYFSSPFFSIWHMILYIFCSIFLSCSIRLCILLVANYNDNKTLDIHAERNHLSIYYYGKRFDIVILKTDDTLFLSSFIWQSQDIQDERRIMTS